jgi:hypothetical protein
MRRWDNIYSHRLSLIRAAALSTDPEAQVAAAHLLARMSADDPPQEHSLLRLLLPHERVEMFAKWALETRGPYKSAEKREMRRVQRWATEIEQHIAMLKVQRWTTEIVLTGEIQTRWRL